VASAVVEFEGHSGRRRPPSELPSTTTRRLGLTVFAGLRQSQALQQRHRLVLSAQDVLDILFLIKHRHYLNIPICYYLETTLFRAGNRAFEI